ncbi:DUF4494 domain-containing protein [Parabacteroides pacaensis]|uniref:DUF4494 domain-containing protein n=1 Tax=Parabacteroides pacaensis TaxID=2086575 RepID=UPI001F2538CA
MAMHNWFECKVSFEKILENGMQKKVTEPYLVDALSFTEAEARIIEEVRPFISGEFTVADVTRKRYSEIFFNENGDRFYKIKVYFITLDEKVGAEKKTAANMLAQASSLKEAIAVLEEGMKGTLADYTIASVSETQIMDIFPFEANEDKEPDISHKEMSPSKRSTFLKKEVKKFVDSIPKGEKITISAGGLSTTIDKTQGSTPIITSEKGGKYDDVRRVEEDVSTKEDTEASI